MGDSFTGTSLVRTGHAAGHMSGLASDLPSRHTPGIAPGSGRVAFELRRLRTGAALTGRAIAGRMAALRGQMFPFVPVLMGIGIGLWFALPREPAPLAYAPVAALAALLLILRLRGPEAAHLPAMAAGLCLAGFCLAGARSHMVAAPVLNFRYYGPIEGRVVQIDRSYSDQIRLTLDRVVLARMDPDRTPARIRVALHAGAAGAVLPAPGTTVMVTGHLSPPEGPVAPGGFDFQRLAWFSRLGAVGYTRTPMMVLAPADTGTVALWANRLRMTLSGGMQARMDGQAGALAAAFMTGDRSGITSSTNDVMRAANLSHLISISGLHMSLLSGFVFAAIRYGLALIPFVALRINTRKLAAGVALVAATFYLLLAGPEVATERAYAMVAVMLAAILVDRRAITLRSVALAAVLLLVMEPESLVEPGFQMSFAATVALVAGFAALRAPLQGLPGWAMPVVLAVASSLIAGAATAPFAAAHFNRIAGYGLVANLLVTPIMALVVMPAGVLAAVLAPFGLASLALWPMERGTAWVLWVAETVAGWTGALSPVPAPGPVVLPLLALGGMWFAAWPGRARLAGLPVLALALGLWAGAQRPALLLAQDGNLVGMMTPAGRAMSKEKGAGFVADGWLEDDGDLAERPEAAARPGFDGPQNARRFVFAGSPGVHLTGKAAPGKVAEACTWARIVVLNGDAGLNGGAAVVGNAGAAGDVTLQADAGPKGDVSLILDPAGKTGARATGPSDAGASTTGAHDEGPNLAPDTVSVQRGTAVPAAGTAPRGRSADPVADALAARTVPLPGGPGDLSGAILASLGPDGKGCLVLDAPALRRTGAVAIHLDSEGNVARVVTAQEQSGARYWNSRALRREAFGI